MVLYGTFLVNSVKASGSIQEQITHIRKNVYPEKPIEAIKLFESLIVESEYSKVISDADYVGMLVELVDWKITQRHFESAEEWLVKACSKGKKIREVTGNPLARVYYRFAVLDQQYFLNDQYVTYLDSAISAIDQNYEGKEIGTKIHEMKSRHYYDLGDKLKALEVAEKGLLLAGEDHFSINTCFLQLQKIFALLSIGGLDQCEEMIKSLSERVSKDTSLEGFLPYLLAAHGNFFAKKGNIDQSLEYIENALNTMKSGDDDVILKFKFLQQFGLVYMENKHWEEADKCFLECIEILNDTEQYEYVAISYSNLGHSQFSQKNYKDAFDSFYSAFKALARKDYEKGTGKIPRPSEVKILKNYLLPSVLYQNMGEAYLKLYGQGGDISYIEEALDLFLIADKELDKLRRNQRKDLTKLSFRERFKDLYEHAITACHLLNDPEKAYYFFEKSKAILLHDKIREIGANQFLVEEDLVKLRELESNLDDIRASVFENDLYVYQNASYIQLQSELEEFIKGIELTNPAYYSYKFADQVKELQDFQENYLKEDQLFVNFFLPENKKQNEAQVIFALVIGKEESHLHKLKVPDFWEIYDQLNMYISDYESNNSNFKEFTYLSHQLYKKIIEPLDLAPSKRIIFSPDEFMFPFELLSTDPGRNNSFLLKDHPISYTYSAQFMMNGDSNRRIEGQSKLLTVAPGTFDPALKQADLAGSWQAGKRIEGIFPNMAQLYGPDANRSNFFELLPHHKLVNLFTHALANEEGEEPSFFLEDAKIGFSELQNLGALNTELIILSACNTGTGKQFVGEGVFSLSRGFAAAGIPTSITTLWAVDEQATYRVTERFLWHLKEGLSADVALQHAKLDMLEFEDGKYFFPYFWAGNVLIGNPNLRYESAPWASKFPILAFLAIALGLGVYFYRRKL